MSEAKRIFIIRHGETDFNLKNIVQGSGVDSDLNETGRKQAKAFYDHYCEVQFDKVYTSLLKRTHQTVDDFIKAGIPHESLEGLNEISWGDYEGKDHSTAFHQEYLQRVEDWRNGELHLPMKGGESPLEMQARQREAWNHILQKKEEKTVLICMHGRALKAFLCLVLNQNLTEMDTYEHRNLGLYLIELQDNGVTNLILRNDSEHLLKIGAVNDYT